MTRHASGIFVRNDRVRAAPGTTVRVSTGDRKPASKALLMALGSADLVVTCAQPLALGSRVSIAITLPGRYVEFEIPGNVEWENGANYGIVFDYLTARQSYGIGLAREILRAAQSAPATVRSAVR
jgi:hypothetical protein